MNFSQALPLYDANISAKNCLELQTSATSSKYRHNFANLTMRLLARKQFSKCYISISCKKCAFYFLKEFSFL